ncbi:hypothetical protein TanjilG_17558 [Lupinus angustifolius]|uniref:Uncharacterized protein n=1 Tax=Lupinus angustifolius TaxID=3871 RepID=A0A1J7HR32_LUPAN|nr:hypothetical protein TanjilG_17558 [Lupinus angustifolius]
MGCGISSFNTKEASPSRGLNRHNHHPVVVPLITQKSPTNKKYFDDGVIGVMKALHHNDETKATKEVGLNEEKLKEKCVMNKNEEEEERVDNFISLGSPSFRDYCIDYDSMDRSSMADSNDYCDSTDSIMNGSGHDSINSKTMPKNKESVNSNKESKTKERKGHRFRNVIIRGKGRDGRKNLLNFACYNASSESYAEGSINKIVTKTT